MPSGLQILARASRLTPNGSLILAIQTPGLRNLVLETPRREFPSPEHRITTWALEDSHTQEDLRHLGAVRKLGRLLVANLDRQPKLGLLGPVQISKCTTLP